MKNLEDIYLKLLGNPKKGDLAELDRHYRAIKTEIENAKDGPKVDVSTIQKYGELHNAYLYLKTQWTLKRQQESGLILENLNLENNKSKALTRKVNGPDYGAGSTATEFLHTLHSSMKNIAKAGAVIVACAFLIKLGMFLGQNGDVNASQPLVLKRERKPVVQNQPHIEAAAHLEDIEVKFSQPAEVKPQRNDLSQYQNLENIQRDKKLIDRPVKVENIDKGVKVSSDDLELFNAAKSCSAERLNAALQKGKNINQLDENGQTIAHWLCRMNCTPGIRWAVENGVNLDHKDKSGRTPMDWAKISSSLETLQYLNGLN